MKPGEIEPAVNFFENTGLNVHYQHCNEGTVAQPTPPHFVASPPTCARHLADSLFCHRSISLLDLRSRNQASPPLRHVSASGGLTNSLALAQEARKLRFPMRTRFRWKRNRTWIGVARSRCHGKEVENGARVVLRGGGVKSSARLPFEVDRSCTE